MWARRTLLTVVTAFVVLVTTVAGAAPASAHAASGIEPTNFETTLDSVEPRIPGVRVRVIEVGSRLELTNTSGDEVLVLGYDKEPYLRIGRDGVFENVRSPATYLNASRTGVRSLPSTADSSAEPSWRRVSREPVARWHDHRIHWMADEPPPAVRRDPGTRRVVTEWEVPFRAGSTEASAAGRLVWEPSPSAAPWLALAVVLFAVVAAAGALAASGPFRMVFALGAAIVLASDLVHTIGTAAVTEPTLGGRLASGVTSSPTVLLAWVAAVAAAVLVLWRGADRESEGLLAGAFAGMVIAIFGGLVELSMLSRSQLPFAGSATLARLSVAVSLGVGFGLLVAAVVAFRRRPAVDDADEADEADEADDADDADDAGEPVASPA